MSAVLWGTALLLGLGVGHQACTSDVMVWLEGLYWQACKELALVLGGAVVLPLLLLRARPTLGLPHCSGNFTGSVLALCLSISSAYSSCCLSKAEKRKMPR